MALIFVVPFIITQGNTVPVTVDKTLYYSVLAGDDLDALNSMLTKFNQITFPEKEAYEGALLMKKAGLVKKLKEKLQSFKSGRKKLEDAINNSKGNVEYRFLRLIIQENAPNIVRYKTNLKDDTEIVRTSYKNLSPAIQQVVKDYSKKSAFLKTADL
ncbi:MAG: hypothetical protein WKI04_10945 [Ferruginibacter sp.]